MATISLENTLDLVNINDSLNNKSDEKDSTLKTANGQKTMYSMDKARQPQQDSKFKMQLLNLNPKTKHSIIMHKIRSNQHHLNNRVSNAKHVRFNPLQSQRSSKLT